MTGADQRFRAAFRRHAAGVAVVTMRGEEGPVGFTATSVVSVSVTPDLLSFNVARASSSRIALARASHVGVHLLGAEQADLAERFSRRGIDRFAAPTQWGEGPFGLPVLEGCPARIHAAVRARFPAGDHEIFLAEALSVLLGDGPCGGSHDPLVHHDGEFRRLAGAAPLTGERRAAQRPVEADGVHV